MKIMEKHAVSLVLLSLIASSISAEDLDLPPQPYPS
jgi:hypothetical protein